MLAFLDPAAWILLITVCLCIIHALYSFIVPKADSVYEKAGLRWLALESVTASISLFFLSQVVAGVLLGFAVMIIKNWSPEQLNVWLTSSSTAQFLFVLVFEALTLGGLALFLKRRKATFRDLGLNNPQKKYIVYALAGFATYFMLYIVGRIITSIILPDLNLEQEQQLGFDKKTSGVQLLPIFISLVILPPLVEEIVARGFLFTGLRTKLPFAAAASITSLLFAAVHLGAANDGLLWIAGIDTFILSMVLCYLREKTGSLWPSIGVHFIKNGLAFFIVFNIAQQFR